MMGDTCDARGRFPVTLGSPDLTFVRGLSSTSSGASFLFDGCAAVLSLGNGTTD